MAGDQTELIHYKSHRKLIQMANFILKNKMSKYISKSYSYAESKLGIIFFPLPSSQQTISIKIKTKNPKRQLAIFPHFREENLKSGDFMMKSLNY